MSQLQYFAPCARGLEALLADELRRLGMRSVRSQRAGALFAGSIADGYRACLWSRLASRVLLSLGTCDAESSDSLYEGVRSIAWEEHVSPDGTIAVDATGGNEALRDSRFVAVRVKDAVVDRLRDRFSRRPSVDVAAPDVRINVVIAGTSARLAIDLSGEPLHRRGYRRGGEQVGAPMKETVAAGVLELSGWRDLAAAGGCFLDPLCGSGTIAIEAAAMAGDVAPGILRAHWGFDGWLGHDRSAWDSLLQEADERAEAGRAAIPAIVASDVDARAVAIARGCAKRAGLDSVVTVLERDLADAVPPDGCGRGLVATNPPYGERLEDPGRVVELLGEVARERFAGFRIAVAAPTEVAARLGMPVESAGSLMNGRIRIDVSLAEVGFAGHTAAVDATQFENRLRKMHRHWSKWARRADVTCYRVYDADLPDFAVAVDLYDGAGPDAGKRWVHVAEYAAPADVDAALASARLSAAVSVIADVLETPADHVFLKRRERQRGSAQYERMSTRHVTGVIAEGGLLFEVNLSDYLDTGIFLDHRLTRSLVREMADGTRFLNLFCYTGSATVYAAAGGARETLSVDLSSTYLSWAERNLALNGLDAPEHVRERADVLAWLQAAADSGRRFDLIFCDPPTFSASKRMESTFDVQRDHVHLITASARLLAEEGSMLFSCNRRRFRLDEQALSAAGLAAEDITARTMPPDFERRGDAHRAWFIKRRDR